MTNLTSSDACQQYLEDPEANAAHLETCAECSAMNEGLSVKADAEPPAIDVDALPLAPWEGSSHRPWPLILGGTAIVVAVALALLDAAGMSPMHVAEGSLASMDGIRTLLNRSADGLRSASIGAQIAFGVAFLVVNWLLIVLLRRAPRGMDA